MTHTLHRLGNTGNLADDFVVFAMSAKDINEKGSAALLRRFMEICFEFDPANAGDMKTGNILACSRQDILDNIRDVSIVHAVFTDENTVAALLKRIKQADLGVSVVVSGLFDRVAAAADEAGLRQHTVECSGGIWGKTRKLPPADVLQITTMCGHGMVAAALVEHYARRIRHGKITVEEAALRLAEPCVCGVFNPVRAARLLQAVASRDRELQAVQPGQTTVAPAETGDC
jgi:hypothetical protein